MPIFEFKCVQCGKKFSQLIGMTADSSEPACPKCASTDLVKLVSRFSRPRSEEERLDSLEDAALSGDMDDPANARRWANEMGDEMGEDIGEDFGECLEEDNECW